MRGNETQRSNHFAIRRVGPVLQFFDDKNFDPAWCDAGLIALSRLSAAPRPAPLDHDIRRVMARETSYFVQSFNAGKGGNLKTDAAIACKSATGALRTAERLALSKLGVVAFSSTGDPEMGDYDDEPTVIFRNGQFPSSFD